MARRNRKPLLGRTGRKPKRAKQATCSWLGLRRRKTAWRLAGALALAQFSGTALAQAPPEVLLPSRPTMSRPMYAGGYSPVRGPGRGMAQPGYAGPRGPAPMIAPPPMLSQGGGQVGIPIESTFTPRLVTSSGFGDGLGWDDGFTSMGAWVPIGINNESMVLYLDARGYVAYNRNGGGNFTLGYRYYAPTLDRFFGVYGAYDIDAGTATGETFYQAAVGLESVGKYLSYRLNGYIPVGSTHKGVFNGTVGDPYFRGNHIYFLNRLQTRYQYGGMDGELGGPLPFIGQYGLSGYVGGYWLTSDVDDTIGFKGRLKANVNDDLQVGLRLTHDDIFDTNLWVTMTLRTPRGSWSNFFRKDWLRQPSVQTKMDRSPTRRYRIATDLKTYDTEELAIRPLDGRPYLVLHVDPQGNGGSGTVNNPVAGILGNNKPRYDIIYVRPGALRSNGPITLFNDQRLLSTAVPHMFGTQRGPLILPGFTGGGLPQLRNISSSPSSVIRLANNNEVSGFVINGAGAPSVVNRGIQGNTITSFNINRNQFVSTAGGAIITQIGTGVGVFSDNTYTGLGGGIGPAPGLSVTALSNADLSLEIKRNTITEAAGAGIFIHAADTSSVSAEIANNKINNTVDDATPLTPTQTGQGLLIKTTSRGSFHDSVIDNNVFVANASEGLLFRAQGLSAMRNVLVGDLGGDNNSGNIFTANLNGIGLTRTGNAVVDRLRIIDNDSFANIEDGIDFQIGGGLLDQVDVLVADNNLINNGLDGFFGQVDSDGILVLTLRDNLIAGNTDDGVEFTQNRFTIDNGGVAGTWTGNVVANNGANGIDISAPMLNLFVGTADSANLITRNGLTGMMLQGPGIATFTNNTITFNGEDLPDVTFAGGIDIEGAGSKQFSFVGNRVVNNFGDGVEIEVGVDPDPTAVNSGGFSKSFDLELTDNIVARNFGRGYDVLNKGSSSLDLTIRGTALGRSVIAENGREGIYIVNTASVDQTQQGPTPVVGNPSSDATHGMSATGSISNNPRMVLNILNNNIVGNGIDQTSTVGLDTDSVGGSGLVIRVGTSGGDNGYTFQGGFASGVLGGVTATVTGNFLSGNFGADVYTESFTSTVDPPTTASSDGWDDTNFDVDRYWSDPLARMDLTFTGNTFESTDFLNLGAFYDNDEDEFKSRTNNKTAPDPDGPFRSGTRRRNAQRLAFRGNLPPFGVPNALSDAFLYPGMGQSTFRISQSTFLGSNTVINPGGTTTVIGGALPFFQLDDDPYLSVANAHGVPLINSFFGELPYGYSVAP